AARLRAVPLRPGAVPLLREPVGQPPARLLGQLEVPHVRDARDRAGAQVEDAQRIPRHVDRLRALLRLIERLLRGPQAEDDEAAVVAEHAALPPLDAERLCLAGERLDHQHGVTAIRLEAVESGPAVGRERLADDTLPDVVVRMVERLAGGGLRGRARGEQQQREAAAERAAEHEHRYLLVSLEARSGNYGR